MHHFTFKDDLIKKIAAGLVLGNLAWTAVSQFMTAIFQIIVQPIATYISDKLGLVTPNMSMIWDLDGKGVYTVDFQSLLRILIITFALAVTVVLIALSIKYGLKLCMKLKGKLKEMKEEATKEVAEETKEDKK